MLARKTRFPFLRPAAAAIALIAGAAAAPEPAHAQHHSFSGHHGGHHAGRHHGGHFSGRHHVGGHSGGFGLHFSVGSHNNFNRPFRRHGLHRSHGVTTHYRKPYYLGGRHYGSYRHHDSYDYRRHRYSRSHRYPYYRGSYAYDRRHRFKIYKPSHDSVSIKVDTTYEDEAHDYNSRGWAYLADGRAAKALHAFSREAASRSRHGAPKVGYALAKTSLGDHKDAVWAMRRAFRVDPHGAGDVYLDEELHHRVRSLADHYAGGAGHGYTDVDAEFMSAALRYLLHDHEAARHAVNAALEHGDHRASTRNLADLLHDDDYGDGGHEDDGY